jgi:hypothetical protein
MRSTFLFRAALASTLSAQLIPTVFADLDYNRDVRPILAENCFACHGFDEKARKADLRLDVAEQAYAAKALVPGAPDKSELWRRINSTDRAEMMPPPKSRHKLTAAEKRTLRAWIEQGARYAAHWSFIPPSRAARPPVPAGGNAIDAFVRARLAKEGLQPAPEAERATLMRRLALDLTGLPPSAAEVEAFCSERDPDAYGKLVDRLLRSPHLGERLALDWLDAARYADTNGFSIDGGRHMWLWRDWVIQAFNDNKPYDRFLLEQLAGDLLPDRTDADLIATGFQRNNMVTHEGGTIPEENLTNYNVDRVKTLGETILGLTLGCAQCHDHKYDPLTQRDYYRLYAYFNTLSDKGLDGNAGKNPAPSFTARTVLRTGEVPLLREQIGALKSRLAQVDSDLLRRWTSRQIFGHRVQEFALHTVKLLKVSTPNRGAGFDIDDDNRVRISGAGELAAFDIVAELPRLARVAGVRAVFHPLAEGDLGRGRWDKTSRGTFVLTGFDVTADTVPADQVNLHKLLPVARVTANTWDARFPAADCLGRRNDRGWSPAANHDGPAHVTATFAAPIDAVQTPYLTVQLNFGFGKSMLPGLIELQVFTGTDDGADVPADILKLLALAPGPFTDEQQRRLWQYCAEHAEELRGARIDLANLEERLAVLTQPFPTMVMDMAPKPRPTFVLHRGDYAQPREPVSAGIPGALPAAPAAAPASRLGLARWLTMPSHPLTARVAVNRFWQMLFGSGLVATPADFGAQGEMPSHPELLDWLAVEFVDSGWDIRKLLRLMVMSATYRQSAAASPALLERDPANRLLARGSRFRLPAELIRDNALKISGLLVPRIGGPSVNPYTPVDLWREVSHYGSTPATAQTFIQDHGEKLYRRSLYTYWKRAAPPPNMAAFDAPNREICVVSRPGTTTPLQALVLLNDTQFVEASRAFAERMLAQQGDDAARLRWAFRETLARAPEERELAVLESALERERRRYAKSPEAALAYLSAGESQRNAALPVPEHAAWAQVAALLFNLSETITRP